MTSKEAVILHAVGDVGPFRENPEYPYKDPIFALSAPVTKNADIVFCQLENILSERPDRRYYNRVSHPNNVHQMSQAGFNVVSFAGNHHMDAGVEAFVDTLNVLKSSNMQPVGVGMNITEARTPAIIERKGTKVAFLGYSSIIPKGEVPYDAEEDRPGCAPMYISTFYEAGDWQPGTPSNIITIANKGDLAAMKQDIRRAKAQADLVVMSFHWGVHHMPGFLAMYQYEVGHAAIDAGADLILGTHAHLVNAIEVYKGKVIFYCLGNFGMDVLRKRPVSGSRETLVRAGFDPEYPTFNRQHPDAKKSVMAKCIISDKNIERVSFVPFMTNKLGQPEPLSGDDKRAGEVYQFTQWCCQNNGLETQFFREGDEIVIHLDKNSQPRASDGDE